jgi:hypothetical protein
MQRRIDKFLGVLFIALVALAGVIAPLGFWSGSGASAAPLPAGPVQVFTLNTASLITNTTFTPTATGGRWSALGTDQPPTVAEVWLFVDETTANTATFTLQVSPDGTTWLPHNTGGGTIAASVAADSNVYTSTVIQGIYYRVAVTVTNSNPLTPVIKVVLR